MRCLTLKQRLQLKRQANDRWLRARLWKEWKRQQRGGHAPEKVIVVLADGSRQRVWADDKISMPAVFCLDENLDETLAFIAANRSKILEQAVQIAQRPPGRRQTHGHVESYFDFKSMKKVSATAALVLAAIYDRRKSITGVRLTTYDEHRWAPQVLAVLRAVGFHELLEMRPLQQDEIDPPSPVRILKFVSGEQVVGEDLGHLQESLANFLPTDERERLLFAEPYAGMLEAALNSHMWAYPPEETWEFPSLPRWWMTGALDTGNKMVTVAVYDQGVSIPASLPRWEHWGRVERMVRLWAARTGLVAPIDDPRNDATAIRLAMAVAQSKTKLPQHGKGLKTMVEVAERARIGRLRILSRNGEYVWETGRKPFARNHPVSIGGTLIEWRLQLSESQ